jgi:NlpC/P60 family putative phage cell wall peptidase
MDPGLRREPVQGRTENMSPIGCAAAIKYHHGGTENTEADTALRDLRASVVQEAESWIGTPFHHAARVKGSGVDCLMLLAEVYERAGVVAPVEPPFYVPDWHLHRDAERYLEGLTPYAGEITGPPLSGDIALFRFGRTFSHGAIVTQWPLLIHAYWNIGVVRGDATLYPLADRPVKFFTPFQQ